MVKLVLFASSVMVIIIITLCICKRKIKQQEVKDKILKITALLSVFFHYSSLWIDFLKYGTASVDNTMLFPIYPCNICMWLLLIVAFMKNKNTFIYKTIVEFLSIAGTICGLIGLFANEIFISNPNFFDYNALKGLLSHSVMIFGTTFLLTQGYVKLRTLSVTLSTILGLSLFVCDGIIINSLFKVFNLPEVNAMYLLHFPIEKPFINSITLGIIGIIVLFLIMTVYELLFLNREERWYHNINKKQAMNEKKE